MKTFFFSIGGFWFASGLLTYLLGWPAVPLTVCTAGLLHFGHRVFLAEKKDTLTVELAALVNRVIKLENFKRL